MTNFTKLAMLFPLSLMLCANAAAQQHLTGTLPDGATYVIDVPAVWNGTLLLYSHGYVTPGSANPAEDVGDPLTGGYMLAAGYALAGSSYASTGWAVQQAIPDQIATLDVFQSLVGTPTTTVAWGHSLGGMITAGLVQEYPSRFNAALPMCGVVAGGVGEWNGALDGAFAFNTLVAGRNAASRRHHQSGRQLRRCRDDSRRGAGDRARAGANCIGRSSRGPARLVRSRFSRTLADRLHDSASQSVFVAVAG